MRLFAGLRGLYAEDLAEKMGYFEYREQDGLFFVELDKEVESEFWGIGPRVGTDFRTRLGDSPFGISGSVAGAAIFGSRDVKTTTSLAIGGDLGDIGDLCDSFCGGKGESCEEIDVERDSHSDVVYNLEGNVGLDFHAGEQATFTIGYRAQQWWDIREDQSSDDKLGVDDDLLVHGPYAKVTADF